jgi:condensin complex subunit 1
LAKLLFIAGHAAIREIAFLETVENELKSITDVSDASKTPKKKDVAEEDLGQVVGSVEDDVGERFSVIRERELLFGGNSILSVFGPMVRKICADYNPSHVSILTYRTKCKVLYVIPVESDCEANGSAGTM